MILLPHFFKKLSVALTVLVMLVFLCVAVSGLRFSFGAMQLPEMFLFAVALCMLMMSLSAEKHETGELRLLRLQSRERALYATVSVLFMFALINVFFMAVSGEATSAASYFVFWRLLGQFVWVYLLTYLVTFETKVRKMDKV